jgi:4-hydroxy-2-oxoheptanedioate aldolase
LAAYADVSPVVRPAANELVLIKRLLDFGAQTLLIPYVQSRDEAETAEALDRLEDIASVDGVDGIFIGPADLAASMGHPGDLDHPAMVRAIEDAITRLKAIGKPAGILSLNDIFCQRCIALGTSFTAVGIDPGVLRDGVLRLRQKF